MDEDELPPQQLYTPSPRIAVLLDWCMEQVKSVSYHVTVRWLFYQAVQKKGLTKADYGKFKQWTSRARKGYYKEWKPDTLIDDSREFKVHGVALSTPEAWIESMRNKTCTLDKWDTQEKVIIICYEAQAMSSQFDEYTKDFHVTLVPFKGDASIEYKWRLAKEIEQFDKWYNKPIKILYFGDLDKKGEQIPESAMADVRSWCSIEFEYERVGLNPEHVELYNIPEKIEGEGYQWEALSDEPARILIRGHLEKELNLDAMKEVEKLEDKTTERWQKFLDRAHDEIADDEEDEDDEDDDDDEGNGCP